MNPILHDNMKHFRLKNKYSIKEISDIANVDSSVISKYESGDRYIPEKIINLYCDLFGVSPNTLFNYEEINKKYEIPLYEIILANKKPLKFNNEPLSYIEITKEEYNKNYKFAFRAWNMDNSPKIYTGDLMFFTDVKNELLDKDVILYEDSKGIPNIHIYRTYSKNNNIRLDNFSYQICRLFYSMDSFNELKILGRLVEVRSFLKKGGNPWPNGKL